MTEDLFGFIGLGFLMIVQLIAVAFSYGQLNQKVKDLKEGFKEEAIEIKARLDYMNGTVRTNREAIVKIDTKIKEHDLREVWEGD